MPRATRRPPTPSRSASPPFHTTVSHHHFITPLLRRPFILKKASDRYPALQMKLPWNQAKSEPEACAFLCLYRDEACA